MAGDAVDQIEHGYRQWERNIDEVGDPTLKFRKRLLRVRWKAAGLSD